MTLEYGKCLTGISYSAVFSVISWNVSMSLMKIGMVLLSHWQLTVFYLWKGFYFLHFKNEGKSFASCTCLQGIKCIDPLCFCLSPNLKIDQKALHGVKRSFVYLTEWCILCDRCTEIDAEILCCDYMVKTYLLTFGPLLVPPPQPSNPNCQPQYAKLVIWTSGLMIYTCSWILISLTVNW